MRQTVCGETKCSVLGFGCGSVLGRVGRRASLEAMNTAWDAGITLFDTARSYGFGEAEAVLGEFLQGKRQHAVLASKYGLAPQAQSSLRRLALPVVRAVMQVPGARGVLKRGAPSSQPVDGTFSVEGLQQSVEESLRQLRTDYLDVLFLHNASADVLHREDLVLALESLRSSGKILRAGLYTSSTVVAEALPSAPPILSAMQYGADPFHPAIYSLPGGSQHQTLLIANHPFGSEARVASVATHLAAIANDRAVPAALREKLHSADWPMITEVLFGMALDTAHTLVLSMMQPAHIVANARAIDQCRFTAADLTLLRQHMLAGSPVPI